MSYEQTKTDTPPKSIYKLAMLVSPPVNTRQVGSHNAKSK